MQNFDVSATNPNDTIGGGGGCLCSPQKQTDCKPPFVVFKGDELLDNASPIPVVCRACLEGALEEMDGELQLLGDPAYDPAEATTIDEEPLDI